MSEEITTIDLGFVNAYLLKAREGFIVYPGHGRSFPGAAIRAIEL